MTESGTPPVPDDPLEPLVVECLRRRETGGEAALEAYLREVPQQSDALRERLASLRHVGVLDPQDADDSVPERLGDFRLTRKLGEGGMGVVYLAEQESLGRPVALKMVHPGQLYFPRARQRFQREVEAIARLQHPGIVPIISVGEQDGVPYFVMERIPGATLAEALNELSDRAAHSLTADAFWGAVGSLSDAAPPPHREGTWTETCLTLAAKVADALAHAHAHDVLHRDVKASNVMVTPDGRVVLLDFGVARTLEGDGLTRTGSHLGSLPSMSPEQVRGAVHAIDQRSDVYGLGVLLYELLTLRSPFLAPDRHETERRILDGSPTPPRTLNPMVSADAETVCLKAMDRDRDRRYRSAEELARDLRNVLERRPIEARRPDPLVRVTRLAQRHPAWSVGLVLGVLLVVGGPLTLWRQQVMRTRAVQSEQARTRAALIQADRAAQLATQEQARAEHNFERALDSIVKLLASLGFSRFENVPGGEEMRRDLLELAVEASRELLEDQPLHPGARLQAAEIERLLADVLEDLGESARAEVRLRRAIDLCQGLEDVRRGQVRGDLSLARMHNLLGMALSSQGRLDEAEEHHYQGIDLLETIIELEDEDAGRARESLVKSFLNLGVVLMQGDQFDDAEARIRDALDLLEELGAHSRRTLRLPVTVAVLNLGATMMESGRLEDAARQFEDSAARATTLLQQNPSWAHARDLLAISLSNLSLVYQLLDQAEGSRKRQAAIIDLQQRSLAEYRRLCRDYPDNLRRRVSLAKLLLDIVQQGDAPPEGLRAMCQESRTLLEDALATSPAHHEAGLMRIRVDWHEGPIAQRQGDEDLAAEMLCRAADGTGRFLETHPRDPDAITYGLQALVRLSELAPDRIDEGSRPRDQLLAWTELLDQIGPSNDLEQNALVRGVLVQALWASRESSPATTFELLERAVTRAEGSDRSLRDTVLGFLKCAATRDDATAEAMRTRALEILVGLDERNGLTEAFLRDETLEPLRDRPGFPKRRP